MTTPVSAVTPIAERNCGHCTLCCKLLEVRSLDKPRNQWCSSCDQDVGCRIYDDRPSDCDAFQCSFRLMADLDDRWRPSNCGFLMHYEAEAKRLVVHCDPLSRDAWRDAVYSETLDRLARDVAEDGGMMIVWTGQTAALIFPGHIRDLGHVRDDQWFLPIDRLGPNGKPVCDFEVVEPDDPRLPRD